MIAYPKENSAYNKAIFFTLATEVGGVCALAARPSSFRDWAETGALGRARRRSLPGLGRWLKRQLIRGQYNWARGYVEANLGSRAVAWYGLTDNRGA